MLGHGSQLSIGEVVSFPTRVSALAGKKVTHVAIGSEFMCAATGMCERERVCVCRCTASSI